MEEKLHRSKVINAFLWLGSGTLAIQIISWISTIIVIRLLTPADYGLFAMALPVIFFIQMVSTWSFGIALVQHKDIDEDKIRQLSGFIILIYGFAFILVSLAAPAFSYFFDETRLTQLLRFLSVNFIFMSFYLIPDTLLFRDMNFKTKTQVDVSSRLVASIVAPVCAMYSLGVWSLAIAEMCMHITRTIHFNIVSRKFYRPVFRFNKCKELIRFGLAVTGSNFFTYVFNQADKIIVGRFLGENLLGIYAVAFNLALLPKEKIMPIVTQLSFSAYSKIQDDISRIRLNLLGTIEIVSFLSFPLFWGMASVAGEAIPLILGPHWVWVTTPFELLCIIIPFLSISPIYPAGLNAIGKPRVVLTNSVIEALTMVIGLLIGVLYGLRGVCLAWLCFYPIAFIIISQRSLRALNLGMMELFSRLKFPVISSLLMSLSILFVELSLSDSVNYLTLLVISIATGAFVYCSIVYLFKKNEIMKLKRVLFASSRDS